jgi:hypothetical protein
LAKIWKSSFSYYQTKHREIIGRAIQIRGLSVYNKFFPDKLVRRSIYYSGLSPRFSLQASKYADRLFDEIESCREYMNWTKLDKYLFIERIVEIVTGLECFNIKAKKSTWSPKLKWWLAKDLLKKEVDASSIANYFKSVSSSIIYGFCWGYNSLVNIHLSSDEYSNLQETWRLKGLPWLGFWIKDLMTWGTLEPVATALLSNGYVGVRAEAEEMAAEYFAFACSRRYDDPYDPVHVFNWIRSRFVEKDVPETDFPLFVDAKISSKSTIGRAWRVSPIMNGGEIEWRNTAGYKLATSKMPDGIQIAELAGSDFMLDVGGETVRVSD